MGGILQQIDREMPEEPEPNWICKYCGEEFQSERIFKLHIQKEHSDREV